MSVCLWSWPWRRGAVRKAFFAALGERDGFLRSWLGWTGGGNVRGAIELDEAADTIGGADEELDFRGCGSGSLRVRA